MKRLFLITGAITALLAGACTQTQQAQPEPIADAPDTVPAEQSVTSGQEEEARPHVCTGLMSCKLGLCPNGKKYREALAQEKKENDTPPDSEDTEEEVLPSEEQMAAAQKIMQEQAPRTSRKEKHPQATAVAEPAPIDVDEPYPVVTAQNTSGIPGRSGLRMGRFAPPEEAASSGEATAPQPNAAERHGLRSPKLPTVLPMNIDGKITH